MPRRHYLHFLSGVKSEYRRPIGSILAYLRGGCGSFANGIGTVAYGVFATFWLYSVNLFSGPFLPLGTKYSIKFNEILLNGRWIAGDEKIKRDDTLFLEVSARLAEFIRSKRS